VRRRARPKAFGWSGTFSSLKRTIAARGTGRLSRCGGNQGGSDLPIIASARAFLGHCRELV
jgi:hypothetical protein